MDLDTLISNIKENTNNYYNGKDCVPDEVFDDWIDQLRLKDPSNSILREVGWGYDLSTASGEKCNHLSYLSKISNKPRVKKEDELPAGRVKTPKMDGGSVELQYKLGRLTRALTRGNGYIGLDCTEKLKYIVPINLRIKYTGNIVGEYVISDEDSKQISESIAQRNIPNGFLGRNEVDEESCKHFSFIAYKIDWYDKNSINIEFSNRTDIIDFIKSLGFHTVRYELNPIEYQTAINDLRFIDGKHYLLDGIVSDSKDIKVNNDGTINYIDELAYKTITDSAQVEIKNIAWNLTRTGKLTPVVEFDPVDLSGASIQRATAYNAKFLIDNKIGVGSVVEIIRSGEVIPCITQTIMPSEVNLPKICPECGSELKMKGTDLICDNEDCSGHRISDIYQWINTLAPVDNLGWSLQSKFIEKYNIESIDDLYKDYSNEDFTKIEGVGWSKSEKLHEMLKKLKDPHYLSYYIVALNIKGISWTIATAINKETTFDKDLIDNYELTDSMKNQLYNIQGVSDSVVNQFKNSYNKINLYKKYFNLIPYSESSDNSNTKDLIKVCVTGKLNIGTRSEFFSKVKDYAEEVDIKDCDYLVTNNPDSGSSKNKIASELGKKVISENEFYRLIGVVND